MKQILLSSLLLFIFSTGYSQVPNYVPSQDILAWYSFNGNTSDSSGNNEHLVNNGATLTLDRYGIANSAYTFDGVNDYMSNITPSFQMGEDSSFTVSFWMKKSTLNFGMPYWHGKTIGQGGSGKFCHFIQTSSADTTFQWGTNKQGTAWNWCYGSFSSTTWNHIVCVYDNKSMTLYTNNTVEATNNYSITGAQTAVLPFYLGTNLANSNSYFEGDIDDFGIWRRALSPTEINNLFTGCVPIMGDTLTASACNTYTTPGGVTYTNSGMYQDYLTAINGCDSIITIDLTVNNDTYSSITDSVCNKYISPSGKIFLSSGTYKDTIANFTGCDSILTINLTVLKIDTTITLSGNSFVCNSQAADSYQWVDCNNNYSPISGEMSQVFTPSSNGTYAVIISKYGCTDTSGCVTFVGINDVSYQIANFQILPNPANNQIKLEFNSKTNANAIIYNSLGEVVGSYMIIDSEYSININSFESGVYFINLVNEEGIITGRNKFIKL